MPRNDDPTEALLSEFRLTSSQMQAMREDATPEEKRLNRRLDELYAAFCEMERERDAETRRADHAVAEFAATRAARPADTPTPELDDLFFDLMAAEDESVGCRVAPSHPAYCCQWNKREPCEDCRELERQNRRTLQAAFDRGRAAPLPPAVAPAPSGWQPIETAPKDGTTILAFMPTYYQGKGGQFVVLWMDYSDRPGWYSDVSSLHTPTHWQPLPLPPASSETV